MPFSDRTSLAELIEELIEERTLAKQREDQQIDEFNEAKRSWQNVSNNQLEMLKATVKHSIPNVKDDLQFDEIIELLTIQLEKPSNEELVQLQQQLIDSQNHEEDLQRELLTMREQIQELEQTLKDQQAIRQHNEELEEKTRFLTEENLSLTHRLTELEQRALIEVRSLTFPLVSS